MINSRRLLVLLGLSLCTSSLSSSSSGSTSDALVENVHAELISRIASQDISTISLLLTKDGATWLAPATLAALVKAVDKCDPNNVKSAHLALLADFKVRGLDFNSTEFPAKLAKTEVPYSILFVASMLSLFTNDCDFGYALFDRLDHCTDAQKVTATKRWADATKDAVEMAPSNPLIRLCRADALIRIRAFEQVDVDLDSLLSPDHERDLQGNFTLKMFAYGIEAEAKTAALALKLDTVSQEEREDATLAIEALYRKGVRPQPGPGGPADTPISPAADICANYAQFLTQKDHFDPDTALRVAKDGLTSDHSNLACLLVVAKYNTKFGRQLRSLVPGTSIGDIVAQMQEQYNIGFGSRGVTASASFSQGGVVSLLQEGANALTTRSVSTFRGTAAYPGMPSVWRRR